MVKRLAVTLGAFAFLATAMGTASAQTCDPIVVGQPIANTYKLQGTTGELRCTTNAASNRFGTCVNDAGCGGTVGACMQLPWVTADGQIMSFPTGTETTFTVASAGSFPTCEHDLCIPCGNPNATCGGIPGCGSKTCNGGSRINQPCSSDTTNAGGASKCQGSKIKDAGKKAACLAGLQAKIVAAGTGTLDPAKVAKCEAKVLTAFPKLESKPGCTSTGDATAIENKVDAFIDDLVTELGGGTASKCNGAKIKDAGKKAACLAGLQAKIAAAGSGTLDPAKVAKCEAKVLTAFPKLEAKPGCNTTGDATTIENKVDAFIDDLVGELAPATGCPGATCPNCCVNPNGCIPRATQGCCDQPGFIVPTFFVNILGGLCSRVDQIGCGIGKINTSNPQTGDLDVIKTGDTSDPGPDCVYGTGDDPAPLPCSVTGAGNDYNGKVNVVHGNGSADGAGINFRLLTPELSTTWTDSQSPPGSCANGSTYDDGETLVSQLLLKAEPTTAGASGQFVDLNADGCKRAGQGFISSANASTDGPITVSQSPGPLKPQPYNGSSGSVSAAVSMVFSGPNSPIKDIGFVAITPQLPIALAPSQSCSCTVTPACPE